MLNTRQDVSKICTHKAFGAKQRSHLIIAVSIESICLKFDRHRSLLIAVVQVLPKSRGPGHSSQLWSRSLLIAMVQVPPRPLTWSGHSS
ncbi:hypothetical protein RRG08_030794 [Elysia crispata]|uniref:Uncharacterized protein n=1 Tax=Elysia crispata TaxID=231223 RepID=A0AAE0YFQ8_9GAST|nr:hypothetical protein RRG08_030794 [Elysia crispata]